LLSNTAHPKGKSFYLSMKFCAFSFFLISQTLPCFYVTMLFLQNALLISLALGYYDLHCHSCAVPISVSTSEAWYFTHHSSFCTSILTSPSRDSDVDVGTPPQPA
jgi:hypothetical protein